MEIDCLICGHFKVCYSIHFSFADQDSDKLSKYFIELLSSNTKTIPDIQGIVQFSYYCRSCIPDLQFIYETFCEIERLRESLDLKKNECIEKLKNAALKFAVEGNNGNEFSQIQREGGLKIESGLPNQNQSLSRDKLLRGLQNELMDFELEPLAEEVESQEYKIWVSPDDVTIEDNNYESVNSLKISKTVSNENDEDDLTSYALKTYNKKKREIESPAGCSKRLPKPKRFEKNKNQEIQLEGIKPNLRLRQVNSYLDRHRDSDEDVSFVGDSGNVSDEFCHRENNKDNYDDPDYAADQETPKSKAYKKANEVKIEKIERRSRRSRRAQKSVKKRVHWKQAGKVIDIQKEEDNPASDDNDDDDWKSDTDSDTTESDSNSRKDPDYDIEKDMPVLKKKRPKIYTDEYLPTVLTDQSTAKSTQELLEETYRDLIDYYDIKKCMIPVIKLPDSDSDSESEDSRIFPVCPILDCKTKCYRKYTMVEHVKIVHRGMKHPYQCKMCPRKYTQRLDYKDHLNTHTNTLPYSCPECDLRLPTRKKLHDHKLFKHSKAEFQCEHCGKCFITNSIYQVHLTTHSEERPFVCEVCGKSFKLEHLLRHHRTIHSELNLKQYKCDFCCKVYGSPFFLKKHLLHHTGDLPFLCDKCDYRAPYKSLLRSHMVVHNEGRQFECDVCHAKYKAAAVLARHKKHDCGKSKDSKEFVCDKCGKGFRSRSRLLVHAKIHTIVGKPFLCFVCGSSFTQKRNLKRHVDTCHKEAGTDGTGTDEIPTQDCKLSFHCSLCEGGFTTNIDLQRHVQTCHKDTRSCTETVTSTEAISGTSDGIVGLSYEPAVPVPLSMPLLLPPPPSLPQMQDQTCSTFQGLNPWPFLQTYD